MNATTFRERLTEVCKDLSKEQRTPIEKLFHELFKEARKEPEPDTSQTQALAALLREKNELAAQLVDARYTIQNLRAIHASLNQQASELEDQIAFLERNPDVRIPESINLYRINYEFLDRAFNNPRRSEEMLFKGNTNLLFELRKQWLAVARYFKLPRLEAFFKALDREKIIACMQIGFSEAMWWQTVTSPDVHTLSTTRIQLVNFLEE